MKPLIPPLSPAALKLAAKGFEREAAKLELFVKRVNELAKGKR